jgi:hypothetical protein
MPNESKAAACQNCRLCSNVGSELLGYRTGDFKAKLERPSLLQTNPETSGVVMCRPCIFGPTVCIAFQLNADFLHDVGLVDRFVCCRGACVAGSSEGRGKHGRGGPEEISEPGRIIRSTTKATCAEYMKMKVKKMQCAQGPDVTIEIISLICAIRGENLVACSERENCLLSWVVGVADRFPATSAEDFDKHQNDRQMKPSG